MAACAPEGLRIHDLRHHAATLTARMPGITTKELMARIGHASPRAALIYQHATEQRDREIAAYLDSAITDSTAASARLGLSHTGTHERGDAMVLRRRDTSSGS